LIDGLLMTESWPPPPPPPPPPTTPPTTQSREILFQFQPQSDGTPMSCELRNHGAMLGYEVVIYQCAAIA
jgi:hypothetical protein